MTSVSQLASTGGVRFLSTHRKEEAFLRPLGGIYLAAISCKMLAFCLALLATLGGCLLPPDVTYVEENNQSPRITSPDPNPALGFVIQGCGMRTYAARITDPDSYVLYWRVFVDYPRKDDQETQSGQAESGARVSFNIKDDDPRFRGGALVPHMVELMVSDLPFDAEKGHAVPEEAGTVSTLWTVQFVTSDQCE